MKKYWGYHLLLDCGWCDPEKIKDKANIEHWIKELVTDIEMEPVGEPYIARVAEGQVDKEGYTAMQVIVTSHIAAHFVDSANCVYVDVFSCRRFDKEVVKQSMIKHFGCGSIRELYTTRQVD